MAASGGRGLRKGRVRVADGGDAAAEWDDEALGGLESKAVAEAKTHVLAAVGADEDAAAVVGALHRALSTSNPGGEPRSAEAQRQLLFFCNSLHNRRLRPPPPVARMKSWSAFTPHYGEDVTYSMGQLGGSALGVGDDEVIRDESVMTTVGGPGWAARRSAFGDDEVPSSLLSILRSLINPQLLTPP